jgi:hypothetical protein
MNTQKTNLNRYQWILAGVLVIQIILAIVVNLPQRTQATSGPLLEGFDPNAIVEIRIENQTGDRLLLQQIDSEWVLPQKGDFPVNGEKVAELLEKVEKVQTNRLVTRTASSHSQLKVAEDDFISQIVLKKADGTLQRLFLGTSGGAGATHIRYSVNDRVYLTADLAAWEVSPTMSSWIDTTYLTLNQEQIMAVRIQNTNGTFNFTKGDDSLWIYEGVGEGEEFDTEAFLTTVNRLASIRMLEPLGTEVQPSWGFEDPGATVVFELQDETQSTRQLTLTIGGMLADNYAAKSSDSPYYVKITPVYASSLLEMSHDSLLVTEPTPTPEP